MRTAALPRRSPVTPSRLLRGSGRRSGIRCTSRGEHDRDNAAWARCSSGEGLARSGGLLRLLCLVLAFGAGSEPADGRNHARRTGAGLAAEAESRSSEPPPPLVAVTALSGRPRWIPPRRPSPARHPQTALGGARSPNRTGVTPRLKRRPSRPFKGLSTAEICGRGHGRAGLAPRRQAGRSRLRLPRIMTAMRDRSTPDRRACTSPPDAPARRDWSVVVTAWVRSRPS